MDVTTCVLHNVDISSSVNNPLALSPPLSPPLLISPPGTSDDIEVLRDDLGLFPRYFLAKTSLASERGESRSEMCESLFAAEHVVLTSSELSFSLVGDFLLAAETGVFSFILRFRTSSIFSKVNPLLTSGPTGRVRLMAGVFLMANSVDVVFVVVSGSLRGTNLADGRNIFRMKGGFVDVVDVAVVDDVAAIDDVAAVDDVVNVDTADAVVVVADEIGTFSFSSLKAVFNIPIPPSVTHSAKPFMLSDDAERFFRPVVRRSRDDHIRFSLYGGNVPTDDFLDVSYKRTSE